ncbi:MAG: integration host factor subunit beta [Betaproteobacteria bacterium AqS2]|uniref:Integration host factor subunit beta n=1 Tax=Candidatus Amphirhobacter heronislandensis TaxID=1732024 RepID=A0A930UHZ4_9GAMM|nr:integration host factor subunit beta [Betaproteobacteria bacterium AqS2]
MKQSTIVDRLYEAHPDLTKQQIADSVARINEEISNALAQGGRVEIRGFGTFYLSSRAARRIYNPRSREGFMVPGRMVPRFKPGKRLRLKVDGKPAPAGD